MNDSGHAIDAATHLMSVPSQCTLGEGIVWCDRRQAALWVDIEGRALWAHAPDAGISRHWPLPQRPTCVALAHDDELLLGLERGLYRLQLDADLHALLAADGGPELTLLQAVDLPAHVRLNDGRADRAGNFVFGCKDESGGREAGFHQYSYRHGVRRLPLPTVSIANSIAFSPDGTRMYFCDSSRQIIHCCDYDAERAEVGNPRVFACMERADAFPDGSTVDADGHLWNTQWGASRVVCYGTDGSILQVIALPAPHVSCCVIGGRAGDTLLVTSARAELAAAALQSAPQSGNTFLLRLPSLAALPDRPVVLP